ncbi:MAG: phosphatase PAP2 family protein [Candidatus Nitrosotenuis sp.]|nr:MAG: phosphatase PAP2 family protein [Candidatus Nitrosotenuis sp.]
MNRYLGSAVIILAIFVLLSVLVSPKIAQNGKSPIIATDALLFVKVNDSHFPPLNSLMILLTEYGREVVWSLVMILFFVFGGHTGRKAAFAMLIAMIILVPSTIVAKEAVGRLRPEIPNVDFLLAPDTEYSFPSGHAVLVSAGATLALALFRDSRKMLTVSALLAAEAALVCISRVYVGGHYPLDVVGGILFGTGTALVLVSITNSLEKLMGSIKKKILPNRN